MPLLCEIKIKLLSVFWHTYHFSVMSIYKLTYGMSAN